MKMKMKKVASVVAGAVLLIAQGAIAAPADNKIAAPAPGGAPAGSKGVDCSDSIVLDCSFEAGVDGGIWAEASTNFGTPVCDEASCGTGGAPIGPHSGSFWTWFGGIAAVEEGSMTQSVTIPAAATGTLSFWFMAPVCSGDAPDFVEASIDGNVLWTVDATNATYCNIDTAYSEISVDASAYADGASHSIQFRSVVNGVSGTTNFFIDDVDFVTAGVPGGPPAARVDLPSLGTYAMIGLGALLAMFGFVGLRRRRMD